MRETSTVLKHGSSYGNCSRTGICMRYGMFPEISEIVPLRELVGD